MGQQNALKQVYDLAVIGGGIVGLAAARQFLIKHPKLKVCVLEKESKLALHQSGRNSGVVHAGIYYKKNSLKSSMCIRGSKLVKEYCQSKGLQYNECGKLIVATKKKELDRLHDLYKNATLCNIEGVELVNKDQIEKIQPGCTTALEAIWSPKTAIVDWRQVALSYGRDVEERGGYIFTSYLVDKFETKSEGKSIVQVLRNGFLPDLTISAKMVVNCAGLYSDRVAASTGNDKEPIVIPFKGEYFTLSERLASQVKTNIYPVPDPRLPFLGVHITPRIDGSVIVGPTSVLTLGREYYSRGKPISTRDLYETFFESGLMKLISKPRNIVAGLAELHRWFSIARVAKDVARFMPEITNEDLKDNNFCGIRAQVVRSDGEMVDDFLFETGVKPEHRHVLHVRNCPSPAATSSLGIAERIVNMIEDQFLDNTQIG